MAYEKQVWDDSLDGFTQLNAARMNHIEEGLAQVSEVCDSICQHIKYEDVSFTLNPVTYVNGSGQPNNYALSCKKANAQNFLFKKLVKVWPTAAWSVSNQQPVVSMMEAYSTGTYWDSCYFTSNISQNYQIIVRVYYWDD